MKQGLVGRRSEGLFRYQGWPTVAKDENGVLYAVCSGHRLGHICPFGKNFMYVSYDEGETWSSPILVNDTALDDRDAGILPLGNGKLLLTWFNHPPKFYRDNELHIKQKNIKENLHPLFDGMLQTWENLPCDRVKSGSFIRISEDGGKSWGSAIQVPVSSPHGPTILQDGTLLYLGKENFGESNHDADIGAYSSADGGKTWNFCGKVPIPEGIKTDNFYEPHAVQLRNGRILGAIRAQGEWVEFGFTIYLTTSDDNGKTWSVPQPLHICGSPPHLLLHSSGAVILTYGRRKAPFGEMARISYDNGETWGDEIALNDSGLNSDLGYPSTAELSDGSLITVYYQRLPDDDVCSILYTKWSIEETK